MSSDQPRRSRDTAGSAGSPMGSTAAIVIAIVAVVAGFLILRQIRDDDGGSSVSVPDETTAPIDTSVADSSTTSAAVTSTTAPPMVMEGATVVVANASTVNGAAGVLTTALTGKGFTLAKATNATVKQEDSTVLYDPSDPEALAVATTVSTLMGNILVQEVPSPAPIDGGVLPEGVSVLVMLGSDKANLTLDAMGVTTTTVAGATTSTAASSTTTG